MLSRSSDLTKNANLHAQNNMMVLGQVGRYFGSKKNTVKNTLKYSEKKRNLRYFTVFLPYF